MDGLAWPLKRHRTCFTGQVDIEFHSGIVEELCAEAGVANRPTLLSQSGTGRNAVTLPAYSNVGACAADAEFPVDLTSGINQSRARSSFDETACQHALCS